VREILLIGGGGHCVSCIEAIESTGLWTIAGIVDSQEKGSMTLLGYPFLGTDRDLPDFVSRIPNMLVTIGHVKDFSTRSRLYRVATAIGALMPVIEASTSVISKHAHLGPGTVAMHGSTVNAGAKVGENCILNTGSIVEHDCLIGSHTHISTGAIINGACEIGAGVMVGSGTIVRNGLKIGAGVILGAGAVVVKDILEPGIWVGIPARRIV
jgi:sugar O-acyltransferase (sialic acid O-acetyltransferase NeuD family)